MSDNPIKTSRILSLDVFRGLTIVLMILVNSPGNKTPYFFLEHAAWNGFTFADLVFPSFLFIVGVSTVFNLNNKKHEHRLPYGAILRRGFILFALGLFLNIFPNPIHLESFRVYGVLQRIALCYVICSIIYLNSAVKSQILIFLTLILGYWIMMTLIPVPGFGANHLTIEGSWVAYIDQSIFSTSHLYEKFYDPEGFLSTFPSVATTLIGVICGSLLLSQLRNQKKCILIFSTGLLFLLMGWLWDFSFPINKNLWTSSFVLWAGGFSLIGFSFCYFIIDILKWVRWSFPFKVFGMNALFAFIFHVVLLKIQFMLVFELQQGGKGNLKELITEYLFSDFSVQNASLLYSFFFILINFSVVFYLYKKKLFIRI